MRPIDNVYMRASWGREKRGYHSSGITRRVVDNRVEHLKIQTFVSITHPRLGKQSVFKEIPDAILVIVVDLVNGHEGLRKDLLRELVQEVEAHGEVEMD